MLLTSWIQSLRRNLRGQRGTGRSVKRSKQRPMRSPLSCVVERLEDRTLLSALVFESMNLSGGSGPGLTITNTDLDVDSDGTLEFDSIVIDSMMITDNAGDGVAIQLSNMALDSLTIDSSIIDHNTGFGVNITFDNVTLNQLVIGTSTISSHDGGALNINLEDSTIREFSIYESTIASTVDTGAVVELDNSILDEVSIYQATLTGLAFVGVNNSFISNASVLENVLSDNPTGDGLLIDLTSSTADGMVISRNSIAGNAGDGINFDLTDSPLSNLSISDNDVILEEAGPSGGNIFLTGHDVFFHQGQEGFDDVILNFLRDAGTSREIPADEYSLAVIGTGATSFWGFTGSEQDKTGYEATTYFDSNDLISGAALWSDVLSHDALIILSHESAPAFLDTPGSDNINSMAAAIATAVNAGMDIWANSSGTHPTYYDFLPSGAVAAGAPIIGASGFSATPEGAALGILPNMINGYPTHSRFINLAPVFTTFEVRGTEIISVGVRGANISGGGIGTGGSGSGIANNAGYGVNFELVRSDLDGLTIDGNLVQNNDLGGVNFNLVDSNIDEQGGVPNLIADNTISDNEGPGINFDVTVTPGFVAANGGPLSVDFQSTGGGITRNAITGNNGAGVLANLPNDVEFEADVTRNTIRENQGFGVGVIARDRTPTQTVDVELIVGGVDPADGNMLDANADAAVYLQLQDTARGRLEVRNNTITGTQGDGHGVHVDLIGTDLAFEATNLLTHSVIDGNFIGTNAAGDVAGNAGHAVFFQIDEQSRVEDLYVTNNTIRNNTGDGIHFERDGDAALVHTKSAPDGQNRAATFNNNILEDNQDGIEIIARNGSLDVLDFEILGNTITQNNSRGIHLRAEADANIAADLIDNRIESNAGDGILVTSREQGGTDKRDIGGTWIKNTIMNNGGRGILLAGHHGVTSPLFIGLDGADPVDGVDRRNMIENNGNDGIEITRGGFAAITNNVIAGNATGGIDIRNTGLNATHTTSIENNLITQNSGHGIDVDTSANFMTIRDNRVTENTGDGIEFRTSVNNTLVATVAGNFVVSNMGRGIDILTQGNNASSNIKIGDSTIPNDAGRNLIAGNGEEGIYFVFTPSTSQSQAVPSTDALMSDGSLTAQPNAILQVDTNTINDNGQLSNLSSTGLVMRIGSMATGNSAGSLFTNAPGTAGGFGTDGNPSVFATGNGRTNARVVGNIFEGNFGDDVFIESFTATGNPPTTSDQWNATMFRVLSGSRIDPLARLNLVFEGNVGNGLDVTRGRSDLQSNTPAGASYNNAEPDFKSRTPKMAPNPSGQFPAGGTRQRNAQRVASRVNAQASTGGGLSILPPGAQTTGSITNVANVGGVLRVTSSGHGLNGNDLVEIHGVQAGGARHTANGVFRITNTTTNTFDLIGADGNASPGYTGGGNWILVPEQGGPSNFLYSGMGHSTFRVAQGYDGIGPDQFQDGDGFYFDPRGEFLGGAFGELEYSWGIWSPQASSFPDPDEFILDSLRSSFAPTQVTAEFIPVTPDPRTTVVNEIIVDFTEPVNVGAVGVNDFTLTRDGVEISLAGATLTPVLPEADGFGSRFILGNLSPITNVAGDYELRLQAQGSGIRDRFGNPLNPVKDVSSNISTTGIITGATNASPIVITSADHGLVSGTVVTVKDVEGNGGANESWTITVLDDDNFQLDGSSGTGTYLGGGTWTASIAAIESWQLDVTLPVADIVDVDPDPRTTAVGEVLVTFTEDVTGVDIGDFQLTRDGINVPLSGVTLQQLSPREYVLDLTTKTSFAGDYVLTLNQAGSNIRDLSGNDLAASVSDAWTLDIMLPTADIVDVTPDPRNVNAGVVTVNFSEPVSGVDLTPGAGNFTLTRDGAVVSLAGVSVVQNSATEYTLDLSSVTNAEGTYELRFNAVGSGIVDSAGNEIAVDAVDTWTIDTTAPTAQIEPVTPDPRFDPVDEVSIHFSEAVTGVDISDFELTRNGVPIELGPAGANLTVTQVTSSHYVIGLSGVTGADGDYELRLQHAGSGIMDMASNLLGTDASDTWRTGTDTTPPVGMFDVVTPDPRTTPVGVVTINFSEEIRGIDLTPGASDFSLTVDADGAGPISPVSVDLSSVSVNQVTPARYTLDLSNVTTTNGTYVLSLNPGGSIVDLAGNALAASATESWTKVGTGPVADIEDITPDPRVSEVGLVTVNFSEDVVGVDISDFVLTRDGAEVALAGVSVTQVTPSQYTLDLSSVTGPEGTYRLTLQAAGSNIQTIAGDAMTSDASDEWFRGIDIFVDSTADSIDVAPGDGISADAQGRSTLRAAIMEANALPGVNTVVLGPGIFQLGLAGDGEDFAQTGDLDILDDLNIIGAGTLRGSITGASNGGPIVITSADHGLSTGHEVRVTGIKGNSAANGTFSITVLDDDRFVLDGSDGTSSGTYAGGGTWVAEGTIIDGNQLDRVLHVFGGVTVNLEGVTIRGGRVILSNDGGGIRNAGTLNITDSVVTGNVAQDTAGAINNSGVLTITGSTISNNAALTGNAGGLRNTGTVTIVDSTFSGNTTPLSGGGLLNLSTGTVDIVNSTFSGNEAGGSGGGIRNSGTVNLTNVTIAENESGAGGGGIFNNGTANVQNTLIANNTAGGDDDVSGSFNSLGNNLIADIGNSTGFSPTLSDIVGGAMNPLDPLLTPLQDNGGPTLTHALRLGSPAIDAGNNAVATATEQRGGERRLDGTGMQATSVIDIGAVEFGNLFVNHTDDSVDASPGDGVVADSNGFATLRAAVMEANALPGENVIFLGPERYTFTRAGRNENSASTGDLDVSDMSGSLRIVGAGSRSGRVLGASNDGPIVITSPDHRLSNGDLVTVRGVTGNIAANGIFTVTVIDEDSFALDGSDGSTSSPFLGDGTWSTGATVIDADGLDRAFQVFSNVELALEGVVIRGGNVVGEGSGGAIHSVGRLELQNTTVYASEGDFGGAIYSDANAITDLTDSILFGNRAQSDGGGAFANDNSQLTVTRTTITRNAAPNDGGGIYINLNATLAVNGSTISDNRADADGSGAGQGGGIYINDQSTLTISGSTISGNSAVEGGGLFHELASVLNIDTSTISRNAANYGGGIFNEEGILSLTDSVLAGNSAVVDGGGIFNSNAGRITGTGVTVADNTAGQRGAGIANFGTELNLVGGTLSDNVAGSLGGALYNNQQTGSVSLSGFDVIANRAVFGGGIYNAELGRIDVSASTFSGNQAVYDGRPGGGGRGGAVFNTNEGVITISTSTFDANRAVDDGSGTGGQGGGFYNHDVGQITVTGSTVSRNTADADGGGFFNHPGATLAFLNSTLSGNVAAGDGGAVKNWGNLTITSSTVADNTAFAGGGIDNSLGVVRPKNTILADNHALGGADPDVRGDFLTQGNNLVGIRGSAIGFTHGVQGDIVGTAANPVDPALGDLQDNGGPTSTHALLFGSPARDAGSNVAAPATDQRGFARLFDGDGNGSPIIDIGAFESGFIVNAFDDSRDVVPGDGVAADSRGKSTLRAAIMEANARDGDDTIILGPGTYTLGLAGRNEDVAASGDIDILDNLQIIGSGSDQTVIDGAELDRIFQIFTGVSVTISGVTIRGGDSGATADGGGIYNLGNLTLNDVVISDNTAKLGGGIYNSGQLSLTDVTIGGGIVDGNTAIVHGGGIYNDMNGVLTIHASELSFNVATDEGGAIHNAAGGTVTLTESMLFENRAGSDGGAIFNSDHTSSPDAVGGTTQFTITGSTLFDNFANSRGGAIFNANAMDVVTSTLSGNRALSRGGAIANTGELDLTNVTITRNRVDSRGAGVVNEGDGVVNAKNSIIAGNFLTSSLAATSDPDVLGDGFNSLGNNLIGVGDGVAGFTHGVNGDLVGLASRPLDPVVGPLQDNGGPTWTHALLAGSPAINNADNTGGPSTDQRGARRPTDTNADIGAFEIVIQELTIDDITQMETNSGQTLFEFTVTLSAPSSELVTVDFATADGTAQDENGDNDYLSTSGTLIFNPGQLTRKIQVWVNGNNTIEPHETFFVNLSNATGAMLADDQGIGTILNDETSLSIEDVTMVEGDSGTTEFEFTISLAQASSLPVDVQVYTTDGFGPVGTNATVLDDDYAPVALLDVRFEPGEIHKTVTVSVTGDTKFENDETFFVNLINAVNAQITDGEALGTIQNDDSRPTVSINDIQQTEGDSGQTAFEFTISLSNASIEPVTVDYRTADGTATLLDGDYDPILNDSVTFAPGETTKTIVVNVNGDTLVERDETFFVELVNPVNATLGDDLGEATIENDDTTMLVIDDVTMSEGSNGTQQFEFEVTLSNNPVDTSFTVDVVVAGDTAADGEDFTGFTQTLTFQAGTTSQSMMVPVTVFGDTTVELDEKFTVTLTNLQNEGRGIIIGDGVGVGTILNDDSATVSIVPSASADETDSGTKSVDFDVTLSQPSDVPVTVLANTTDGTATVADGDYDPLNDFVVTFRPGETTKTVSVTVNGDTKLEDDETFTVTLSHLESDERAVTLGNATATGTIRNDDSTPQIQIDDVTQAETDGETTFTFDINLTNASHETVSVTYATGNGTALAFVDYEAKSDTLTFLPDETHKTITITVLGDSTVERDETFFVNLSNPKNAEFAGPLPTIQATGTIVNDDTTTISVEDATIVEGDDGTQVLEFTIHFGNNPVDVPVTVRATTADDTATAGDDYQAADETFTFAAGTNSTTRTVQVAIHGDQTVERNERFFLNLLDLDAGGREAGIILDSGQGTIQNDDAATISIEDVEKLETNSGTTEFVFTITLSRPVDAEISMQVDTTDGSAFSGEDYISLNAEKVTFAAGEIKKTIAVQVIGDQRVEPDETFFVNLSTLANSGRNVTFAKSQARGTIVDDEPRTFTVNSTADKPDLNPGDGVVTTGTDGEVTLRAAIMEANARPNRDTIIVPSGHYILSITGRSEDGAATGDLDITDAVGKLILRGAGQGSTIIDAAGLDRVFDVHSHVVVDFSGMTITGGDANSGLGGGGILNRGTITVTESMLSNNSANGGVGLGGGGIRNLGSATISDSTLAGNSADGGVGLGGGAINNTGTLLIVNSTLYSNTADGGGNEGGGAIRNLGFATVVTSTISGNAANATGGGGGIHNSGQITVTHSTIVNNTAGGIAGGGGGIRNSESGASFSLRNTIVASNTATTADKDARGDFTSGGHNLIGNVASATGFTHGTNGDIVGGGSRAVINPQLGPLQDNGGLTWTHAPMRTSPAVDAGDNSGASSGDQRGFERIVDANRDGVARIDIGAVEMQIRSRFLLPHNVVSDTTPTFQWTPIDNAVRYQLWVGTAADPNTPVLNITNLTGTQFTPQTPLPLGEYRAFVRAIYSDGSPGMFTPGGYPFEIVADVPAPAKPVITGPTGSVSGNDITYTWNSVQYAAVYELYVANVLDEDNPVIRRSGIRETSYTSTIELPEGEYKAWVQAINADGDVSQFGAPVQFKVQNTVVIDVPEAPTPTAPVGTVSDDLTPLFTWTPVSGAVRYDIWVNVAGSNELVFRNINVTDPFIRSEVPLVNGQRYIWTVRGFNSQGEPGEWASHARFTMDVTLAAPTIVGPSDTASPMTNFQWNAVPGATRYDIWVNDLTTGQSGVIRDANVTGTSFTPSTPLKTGHRYIWTMRAIDGNGVLGQWAPHHVFTVSSDLIPTLTSPVGTATSTSPEFTWSEIPGAVQYDIWVNDLTTGQSGVIRDRNVSGTSFTPTTPLVNGHRYIWTVQGILANGMQSEWAKHAVFQVDAVSISEAPTLLAPVNTTSGTSVKFEWTPVAGAVRYDIWVNVAGSNQFVFRNTNVQGTSLTMDLTPGRKYIWTVRGLDANDQGSEWAQHKMFTVAQVENQPLVGDQPETSAPAVDDLVPAAGETEFAEEERFEAIAQTSVSFATSHVAVLTRDEAVEEKPTQVADVAEIADMAEIDDVAVSQQETDAVMAEWVDMDWWKATSKDAAETQRADASDHVAERPTLAGRMLAVAAPMLLGRRFVRRNGDKRRSK